MGDGGAHMPAGAEKQQFYLLKGVNKTIREHAMISEGDHVAVAVSGGKDSLTLLQLLWARRELVKEAYELIALHVTGDPETCASPGNPDPLISYFQELGVAHQVLSLERPSGQAQRPHQSPCFHCAWRRRKALFRAAHGLGCTKVAFAHHADDLAQTTLLNLFFQGRAETMRPVMPLFDGELEIIRPLAYTREREIARFAAAAELPVMAQTCPAADQSQRQLMRQIIAQVEKVYPKTRLNLVRAGLDGAEDQDPW